MEVKGNPPVAEAVAKSLTGITSVPSREADAMANRAAIAAQRASDIECKRQTQELREALVYIQGLAEAQELRDFETIADLARRALEDTENEI